MTTRQVGWEWRGLAVWSPSGCRLVCSLRQTAQDAVSTPRVPLSVHSPLIPSGPGSMPLPLESGISAMTWSAAGYSLLLTETASSGQMLELALARSLDAAHRVVQGSRPGAASAAAGFFSGRPAKQVLPNAATAMPWLGLPLSSVTAGPGTHPHEISSELGPHRDHGGNCVPPRHVVAARP